MELRNYSNVPQSRIAFQAKTSIPLKTELQSLARESKFAEESMAALNKKFEAIERAGDKASEIVASFDLSEGVRNLSLFNKKFSSSYGGSLPMKNNNILDSFMALEEKDILKAENEIKDIVSTNKTALILKAVKDKDTMIKIAGKANPTDEEFAAAIDRLSEEEIINLRLGIDNRPAENGMSIDFQI